MKRNTTTSKTKVVGIALAAAGLLTACFGGGDHTGMVTPPMAAATSVPDSALASSSAYESFTATAASTSTETAEPLTADNVATPPSSDTDEPAAVT